jgi:hypothetical protein
VTRTSSEYLGAVKETKNVLDKFEPVYQLAGELISHVPYQLTGQQLSDLKRVTMEYRRQSSPRN